MAARCQLVLPREVGRAAPRTATEQAEQQATAAEEQPSWQVSAAERGRRPRGRGAESSRAGRLAGAATQVAQNRPQRDDHDPQRGEERMPSGCRAAVTGDKVGRGTTAQCQRESRSNMEGRGPDAAIPSCTLFRPVDPPLVGQCVEGEEAAAHRRQNGVRSGEERRRQGRLLRVRLLAEDRQAGRLSPRVAIPHVLNRLSSSKR